MVLVAKHLVGKVASSLHMLTYMGQSTYGENQIISRFYKTWG